MSEDQTIPIDLDYRDPRPVELDLAAIERRGARIRVRRRVAGTAAVAVLAAGVAGGVAVLRPPGTSSPSSGTGLRPIAQFLARNPPSGEPAVISTSPRDWTSFGWVTADGQFCYAAYRIPAAGRPAQGDCYGIDGDLGADGAVGASVGMPLPAVGAMDADMPSATAKDALHLFVGVVRGDVARVSMTAYGRAFEADVTPVTTRDGVEIGIYEIWFASPSGYWNATDIQGVVAYDSSDAVVARQSPWAVPTKGGS
jgi:hypothetical protein